MKNKLNLRIDENFKKYSFRQIIFILGITLFFFVLFYFNFGLVMASFIIWAFLILGVLFLYLDIKFMFKIQKINEELENLKFIVRNIKKK